jgi:hypothetical protein
MTGSGTRRRRRVDMVGQIKIRPGMYAAIAQLALAEDRKIAAMARLLIRESLARRGIVPAADPDRATDAGA